MDELEGGGPDALGGSQSPGGIDVLAGIPMSAGAAAS